MWQQRQQRNVPRPGRSGPRRGHKDATQPSRHYRLSCVAADLATASTVHEQWANGLPILWSEFDACCHANARCTSITLVARDDDTTFQRVFVGYFHVAWPQNKVHSTTKNLDILLKKRCANGASQDYLVVEATGAAMSRCDSLTETPEIRSGHLQELPHRQTGAPRIASRACPSADSGGKIPGFKHLQIALLGKRLPCLHPCASARTHTPPLFPALPFYRVSFPSVPTLRFETGGGRMVGTVPGE